MTEELADKLIALAEWIIRIDVANQGRRNLPKPVRAMTPDEHAIYALAARYAGQFMFLTQEATTIMMAVDPQRLDELLVSKEIDVPEDAPQDIDQPVKTIAQFILEEEAKQQSAASQGSPSALEAIMARISAEVTREALRKKAGG